MLRSVHAFQPVSGRTDDIRAAFAADPQRWLPDAAAAGDDRWTTKVRGGGLTRTVTARVGPPREAADTVWRSLSWDPSAGEDDHGAVERFLPSLAGELGLHVAIGEATLMLDAQYEPPGGIAGAALDAVALHQVARHTLDRFLVDVAAALSAHALQDAPEGEMEGAGRTVDPHDGA
jgi:hypothetical protein